jgi:DNA-binding beta-propeller fold protein YncE
VPSAVAVANDGTLAAAGFGAPDVVGLIPLEGLALDASIGCRPVDVAIAPDATYAWAVCQGDSHIHVIDVGTGELVRAGIGTVNTDDIVYLPDVKRLVVADLEGEIVVVSATSLDDYAIITRIATPDFHPTELAPLPDGSGTYVVSDSGRLAYVDFTNGAVTPLTAQGPETFLLSLSLARTGTLLYAGAVLGPSDGSRRSAVVALDPATGRVRQVLPLEFTLSGYTSIAVATGYRSLSVGTGLGVLVDGVETGALEVALDPQGRMGAVTELFPYTAYAADVSRSGDGTWAGVATTDATVVAADVEDSPYPPQVTAKGSLRGAMLTLSGATGGMRPGARVTVHIKDLTKKKSRFVRQAVEAKTTATGEYRWKGKAPSARMQVYTSANGVKSKAITVTARK